jgi:hypothetical protein
MKDSERGTVLVLTAMCLGILMGFLGLALDVALLYRARQRVQIAADAAATAAALDWVYNNPSTTSAKNQGYAAASRNGFTASGSGCTYGCTSVTVNVPPLSGPVISSGYAEAIVTAPNPTAFMSILGFGNVAVTARAVAGSPAAGTSCFWLTGGSTGVALDLQGDAEIDAPNCGIFITSTSNNSIEQTGNKGSVVASYVDTEGDPTPKHWNGPTITTDVAPRSEPWGSLPGPSTSACNITSGLTSITTGNQSQVQGTSGSPVVCFTGAVTLNDGVVLGGASSGVVYVFENGVTIATGATVTLGSCSSCNLTSTPPVFAATDGAVMDLYGGTLNQDSNSVLNIFGPTAGTYNGIALLQPTSNTTNDTESNPLQIQFGSSNETLDGYIFAPDSVLYLQDHGGGVTASGVVAAELYDKSSSTNIVDIPSYDSANSGTAINRQVTLVE